MVQATFANKCICIHFYTGTYFSLELYSIFLIRPLLLLRLGRYSAVCESSSLLLKNAGARAQEKGCTLPVVVTLIIAKAFKVWKWDFTGAIPNPVSGTESIRYWSRKNFWGGALPSSLYKVFLSFTWLKTLCIFLFLMPKLNGLWFAYRGIYCHQGTNSFYWWLWNHFACPKWNVTAFSAVRCAVETKFKWTKAKQSERNQYPWISLFEKYCIV